MGAFLALGKGRPGGPLWVSVGFLGVSAGFVILSYYSVVAGWTVHYVLLAVQGKLSVLARDPAALQAHFVTDFLASGPKQVGYHLVFMTATVGAVFFGVKGGHRAGGQGAHAPAVRHHPVPGDLLHHHPGLRGRPCASCSARISATSR